jgi:hypothetical protein
VEEHEQRFASSFPAKLSCIGGRGIGKIAENNLFHLFITWIIFFVGLL